MYAIYNKSNNKVINRFYGDENKIGEIYDMNIFGYIPTTEQEFNGDPTEYIVDVENIKVVRRNIDEIIAEIENKNPMIKKVNDLQVENNQFKQLLNLVPPILNPTTLEDYKKNKVFELSLSCNEHILNGFYSDCRGIEEFYSCSQLDQQNVNGYIAMLGANPELNNILWKSANETLCTPFTSEQMIKLGSDMMNHVQENIYRFELLRNQVMDLITDSIDKVVEIVW